MPDDETTPERIDAATTPGPEVDGTADGNPVAGVEMSEKQKDEAVKPDDAAFEVDGPQASAGHA